jgi:hypothetical protein
MRVDASPRFPADMGQLIRKLTDLFKDYGKQLNDLSEGRSSAITNGMSSVPTTGTWKIGDFVRNTAPAEAGLATAKYVVIGWVRITSGSGNTINTDWLAARSLTGN